MLGQQAGQAQLEVQQNGVLGCKPAAVPTLPSDLQAVVARSDVLQKALLAQKNHYEGCTAGTHTTAEQTPPGAMMMTPHDVGYAGSLLGVQNGATTKMESGLQLHAVTSTQAQEEPSVDQPMAAYNVTRLQQEAEQIAQQNQDMQHQLQELQKIKEQLKEAELDKLRNDEAAKKQHDETIQNMHAQHEVQLLVVVEMLPVFVALLAFLQLLAEFLQLFLQLVFLQLFLLMVA
jgi:hypothetical protein